MPIDWPGFLSIDARIDFWAILVGITCTTCCALVGCFLVLRRMSLLGDAISHSILAGLAVAFLTTGRLDAGPMMAGALAAGLLTAMLTQTLRNVGQVAEDSSMGIVFTGFFAVGVLIISNVNVHLDTDCVLYGKVEWSAVAVSQIGPVQFPRAMQTLLPVLVLTIVFVVGFWKELKIASFDPTLATAMGFSAIVVHYLLMAMVSLVTVASLEAVGAIVVVAMLIVPAATAHLLTDRLRNLVMLAILSGTISAVLGVLSARWLSTSAAGMMAVWSGVQLTLAVVFSPRYGWISKMLGQARLVLRIASEDVIAMLYRLEEKRPAARSADAATATVASCRRFAGSGWPALLAIPRLRREGSIEQLADGVRLTARGRRRGESLLRSHRLWESYLDEHFDLPADHLHEPAERIEHFIGPRLQEQLARELAEPQTDPHGRNIPALDDDRNRDTPASG